jgi:hypothetical protein
MNCQNIRVKRGGMLRLTITIAIVLLLTILGVISLIYFDYESAIIWLSSSVLILFIVSYSKSISEIFKEKFSIGQIKKLTKKIITDLVL